MKKAFTMIELVFVIVIVGILSYFAASGFQRNPLREAADQVVSHIRYTQHLAMMDNKFDPNNSTWYGTRWQIEFGTTAANNNGFIYGISSDNNNNGVTTDIVDQARNPLDPNKILSGWLFFGANLYTQEMDLTAKYGINNVTFSNTCLLAGNGRMMLFFDNLGRPMFNDPLTTARPYVTNRMVVQDCNITLLNATNNIVITITPETGYTYISSQN